MPKFASRPEGGNRYCCRRSLNAGSSGDIVSRLYLAFPTIVPFKAKRFSRSTHKWATVKGNIDKKIYNNMFML
jgi:hypothetical protein